MTAVCAVGHPMTTTNTAISLKNGHPFCLRCLAQVVAITDPIERRIAMTMSDLEQLPSREEVCHAH